MHQVNLDTLKPCQKRQPLGDGRIACLHPRVRSFMPDGEIPPINCVICKLDQHENLPAFVATSTRPLLRTLTEAKDCKHLGANLTPEEVKQYEDELRAGGIPCKSCTGAIPGFHCKHPTAGPFTAIGKCVACSPEHYERKADAGQGDGA